ncbi:MAG: aminotransferase class I/II-fold pyridoxal phosphate-dependent enzyme, partial [Thermoplasmata archaeon]
ISDRMIVTSSLSKAFGMGGLRLGWAIARSDLIERIEGLKEYLTVACATPSERIARLALARKRKLLERAWDIVRRNRPIVEEWVERNESVECSTVGSVNFFFPRLVGVDESRFARISAVKYKTLIAPGRYFGLPSHFRLGYGMETEKLREGLKNLGQALKEASLA